MLFGRLREKANRKYIHYRGHPVTKESFPQLQEQANTLDRFLEAQARAQIASIVQQVPRNARFLAMEELDGTMALHTPVALAQPEDLIIGELGSEPFAC